MPESFVVAALTKVAEKAADVLVDRVVERIFDQIDPQISRLQNSLNDVKAILDDVRIAPLRAGLKHLQLRDFAKAREHFITAEAMNPLAAVPNAHLAITLSDSKTASHMVREHLLRALKLNPYWTLEWARLTSLRDFLAEEHLNDTPAQPDEVRRTWSLNDDGLNLITDKRVGPLDILTRYKMLFGTRATNPPIAFTGGALCGNWLALEWCRGENLLRQPKRMLSVFEVSSKEPLWCLEMPNERLCTLTYEHLVTRGDQDNRYLLRDPNTGNLISPLEARYFDLMYGGCPQDTLPYQRSNWRAISFTEASARSPGSYGGRRPALTETAGLHDPCGLQIARVRITNHWHLHHSLGGEGLAPTTRLYADPTVECESETTHA